MRILTTTVVVAVLALSGCASTNSFLAERSTTVEMYHIFDIKTTADTATVAKAATTGLSQNTNQISSNLPLQLGTTVPSEPARFSIEEIKVGGGFGALMAMQNGGAGMKVATCKDASWTTRAVRDIAGSNKLTLYGCLFKYKTGYNLDVYAVFNKVEGGLMQVSRGIASSLVGTPEEWVNKTIVDMVRTIESQTNAKIAHLEGQPEIGNLPWVDRMDTNVKASSN